MESRSFSTGTRFNQAGAAMFVNQQSRAKENDTEDDMAVHAALWFIFAGVIAFLSYGCVHTARR